MPEEDGLAFLRHAFRTGTGLDGMPINVPPVQQPVPVVVRGLARAPIDRAARFADGHIAYSFISIDPEEELTRLWHQQISPTAGDAASRPHGRQLHAGDQLVDLAVG